jgi:hypothetical protein
LLELLLIGQMLPHNIESEYKAENGVTLVPDDIEHVMEVYEYVGSRLKDMHNPRLYAELEVDPLFTFEGESVCKGTADVVIIDAESKTLYVWDLKFGAGIPVGAKENYQLILYALGAFLKFKNIYGIDKVEVGILQPRAYHVDGPYRMWDFPTSQFSDKWTPLFSKVVQQCLGEEHAPEAGDEQCRWCGIAGVCEANAKLALASACDVFSVVGDTTLVEVKTNVLRNPEELTDEQLRVILEARTYVEGWLNAVKDYAEQRFKDHQPIDGFKLVAGRASRKWNIDDDAIVKLMSQIEDLSEDAYMTPRDVKSVAQMEKSVKRLVSKEKWGEISSHIVKYDGKPTLALESDKRPSIASAVNEVFDKVDDFLE